MRMYYGWCIVAISILTLTVAIGGSIQAFGLFVLPVSKSFGLSRAQVYTGAILFNVGMAIAGPLIGRILDRHSARAVAVASAVLFGGSMVALGLSSSVSLNALVILLPLAAAAVGCGTVTSPALVARWFSIHRGRAMAIAMLGISFGPIIVVPLVGLLIDSFGWRHALVLQGVASGLLLLLLALFVRDRPGRDDIEPGSTERADGSPSQAEIHVTTIPTLHLLRLPHFWSLALGLALAYGIMQSIIVSLVPFGAESGLSLTEAASLISTYGASAIVGSLLIAWLGDRFDRAILLTGVVGLFTAAAVSPLLAHDYVTLLASSAFIGVVSGWITPVFLAWLADLFGAASFGTVNGLASFISTIVSAICIRGAGEIFDQTGDYRMMFLAFLAIGLVATLLVFGTRPLHRRFQIQAA